MLSRSPPVITRMSLTVRRILVTGTLKSGPTAIGGEIFDKPGVSQARLEIMEDVDWKIWNLRGACSLNESLLISDDLAGLLPPL